MLGPQIISMIKILTTFIFATVLCYSCYGQPKVPSNFIETTPPRVGTDDWFTLNSSQNEFGVKNEKGQLRVSKVKEINTGYTSNIKR